MELLIPSDANPGDINRLTLIDNQTIDPIAGHNNIPPFSFSKGQVSRRRRNANKEEFDSILQTEVEPEQEWLVQGIVRPFYDPILVTMWGVEPAKVEEIPAKIEHNFETPVIHTEIDPEQFEMLWTQVNNEMTTMEKAKENLRIRDILFDENSWIGGIDISANKE